MAKAALAKAGVSYSSVTRDRADGEAAHVRVGARELIAPEPWRLAEESRAGAAEAFRRDIAAATAAAGYPEQADPAASDKPLVVAIPVWLVMLVTLVFGPIAAMLVEFFASRILFSPLSLPSHPRHGWVGRFLPTAPFP